MPSETYMTRAQWNDELDTPREAAGQEAVVVQQVETPQPQHHTMAYVGVLVAAAFIAAAYLLHAMWKAERSYR